ncbi:MAG: lactate utilization protein [Flavobacteriales bacterium]|nr:lactate utilization protein [Flavobacteriales bacterium]
MNESTSKEKILKKIRKALIQKNDSPYASTDYETPVFHPAENSLDLTFAEAFIAIGGQFRFCENLEELSQGLSALMEEHQWKHVYCFEDNLKDILKDMQLSYVDNKTEFSNIDAGITTCEFLVARTGTILMSSAKSSGRKLPAFAPVHVVIASTNQLQYDLSDGLAALQKKYGEKWPSMVTAITGPSRTADIEKTLIIGAHGPKEVYVFLLDSGKS